MRHLGDLISRRLNRPLGWYLPGGGYIDKVLLYNPIAYWPLSETTGTTADCPINSAMNGTYARNVSTMGTGDGIGDGNTAPLFNGTNDYVNVYSAALAAAFSGAAGTAAIWARVQNAGVWTDATFRNTCSFQVNADNRLWPCRRTSTNNEVHMRYRAAAVSKDLTTTLGGTLLWVHYAVTWNKAADEVKWYINGAQTGATQNGLGVWAGALGATSTALGCEYITPTSQWKGWLAHCAVWNLALTGPQILDLATV